MDNLKEFKDLFESIIENRKKVFLLCLIKDDKKILKEVGFS